MFENKCEINMNTKNEGIQEEAKYSDNHDAEPVGKQLHYDDSGSNLSPYTIGM